MSTFDYPRVLYSGYYPIGHGDATGQTLESLYRDWPRDRLLQVCHDRGNGADLGQLVILPRSLHPVEGLVRLLAGGVSSSRSDGLNIAVAADASSRPDWRIHSRAAMDLLPVVLPREVRLKAQTFGPDVVHTLLGSARAMTVAKSLSYSVGAPIVPHFMDDWIDSLYASGELAGMASRIAKRRLRRVLSRVPLCLTIGIAMQEEFSRRLNKPCVAVGNAVDTADFEMERRPNTGHRRRIAYVGGLHLGRSVVLEEVGRALGVLAQSASDWEIQVYCPAADFESHREILGRVGVTWGGCVSPEDVPKTLIDADALLFVESSVSSIAAFTRLSVSTKVPQYLAARRPVLVVGPRGQGSIEEFRSVSDGIVIVEGGSPPALERGIRDLLAMDLGQSGVGRILPSRFEAEPTRARFGQALTHAASAGRGL